MANKAQQFVVKSVKQARSGDRRFYNEVGRLFIRETEKGVSGTLYIHALGGEFAVFPVEPKDEQETPAGE